MGMVEDVAEFHRVGGTSVPDTIRIDPKAMVLVLWLLRNEHRELILGVKNGDLANVCNEFMDLIYIAIQGLIRMGMSPEQINELWSVLHQANMSKVDPKRGLLADNNYKPYTDARGSFRKPPGFQPVDFPTILRRMQKDKDDKS